jgi:hypothetical protein
MKIVRLVLLLSLVGVPVACNGGAITEPENSAKVAPVPHFNGTAPDTTKSKESGHIIGSGN